MIKIRHSRARLPEFESWRCHFLAVGKTDSIPVVQLGKTRACFAVLLWTTENDAYCPLLLDHSVVW